MITPQTELILVKVPLEIDNSNQLTFANQTAQYNYFNGLSKLDFGDDFTYQRADHVIRVPAGYDDLIEYNYCMYKNDAYSDKWFYAYVDKITYLNDNVSAVSIKTDVWQTWQFDLTYKRTFIEREHVNDDTVGIHTVPENLELGDYEIVDLRDSPMWTRTDSHDEWCVCFCVTAFPSSVSNLDSNGRIQRDVGSIGGVFSMLHFFSTNTLLAAQKIIEAYDADPDVTSDAIINLYMVPSCCVNYGEPSGYSQINGYNLYPIYNFWESDTFTLQQPQVLAGNFSPKNNKLLTWPYSYFYLTNKAGESVEYHYEDFPIQNVEGNTARTMNYKKAIVPSTSIAAKLYFTNYKSYEESSAYGTKLYSYGLNYAKVPVCAWTTDYFTNWLTQNGVNVAVGLGAGVLSAGLGMATMNPVAIAGGAISIGTTIANTLGEIHKADTVPPQAKGDINTGDFTYCFQRNSISFYEMSIRPEYASIIDNYFSAYGYKVNTIKLPNITGRRNWNYIKTVGCYIEAHIPQDDLSEIKQMFNHGVTLWHNPATFADYSQNNDII